MNDELDASVAAVATPDAAIEGADVVVTATNASDPVFDGDLLEPGTHVTAMGQYNPEKRELDATTIRRSTYVPDLRERVTQDAGSFIGALEEGLSTRTTSTPNWERSSPEMRTGERAREEITVFDSGGTAIETVAAARHAVPAGERARTGERNRILTSEPGADGTVSRQVVRSTGRVRAPGPASVRSRALPGRSQRWSHR